MSIPIYVKPSKVFDPQNTWRSEQEILNIAFGGEENVPSVDGVHINKSLMKKQFSRRHFVGYQMSYNPYGATNCIVRRVMKDGNGNIDTEKIREKYTELLEIGKRDEERYQIQLEEQRKKRNSRTELRDEVKEVFKDSEIFDSYNEDILHYDHSYSERFDSDIVRGGMEVKSDGVSLDIQNLSIEETQKVIDLILEMRGN